jgi:hypothetical protein
VTDCPTVTSTAVTRPDWPKLRLAWLEGSMVPDEATVWVMVPVETVCTVVVVVIRVEALELVVANQIPTPAAAATNTAADIVAGLLVNHFLRLGPTYASLAPRSPAHRRVKPRGGGYDEPATGRPCHPTPRTFTPGHSHL